MESRQRKSDRQMHSLLLQTKRLKQENEELQAQMSTSGPSQSRHPQSQQIGSRQIDEASFPRNTEFSQLHDTVWGGAFANSPNVAGRKCRLYLNINDDEACQKVAFVRCDASPIGTSSTKRGGATLRIRNLEGPSRSLNLNIYARTTLSIVKATTS